MLVRPMLLHRMALVSVRLFCKNLGNLQEFFGQMVYRPPWQKIARTPMLPTPGKIPASPQVSSPLRSWPPFLCLCSPKNKQTSKLSRTSLTLGSSGSPRSKYKHRRTLTFEIKKKTTQERGQVTHILCKVSCFLLKSFHFRRLRKR